MRTGRTGERGLLSVKITVVSLFPEVFRDFIASSIIGRAVKGKCVELELVDLRSFSPDKHRKCDDYPYGGGPGMVMKPEPVIKALEAIGIDGKRVIYPSASGTRYTQQAAQRLAKEQSLVIICGHYEGLDQRIIDRFVTDELAIGDYVLSGGESAAMVMIDTIVRLLDGVINSDSLQDESFSNGLLEYPHYTRPRSILGMEVPEILVNGNHEEIRVWRRRRSIEKTVACRPDLIEKQLENEDVKNMLMEREVKIHGSHKSD
jgi:tRNA (guanine37-N1)-methyltransferase